MMIKMFMPNFILMSKKSLRYNDLFYGYFYILVPKNGLVLSAAKSKQ